MIKFEEVKKDDTIRTYIKQADESLIALGFTEHSFAHVDKVSLTCKYILEKMGYDERTVELAQIAGYLHDIGNVINRIDHAQSGAVMAFRLLDKMGADAKDIAIIINAIGNHDESTAFPVNAVSAALIIADKTDVRRSRVRSRDTISFDIHDRVNYSVKNSKIYINDENTSITLELEIDTNYSSVIEYFEIFLDRMMLCNKAAQRLNLKFRLIINDNQVM